MAGFPQVVHIRPYAGSSFEGQERNLVPVREVQSDLHVANSGALHWRIGPLGGKHEYFHACVPWSNASRDWAASCSAACSVGRISARERFCVQKAMPPTAR